MTAAAGEFEGMTALEAREAVVAELRAEGRIARTEPYVHNVPFSHRSRRADRAADLAPVVHAHGRARRAGARAGARRAAADQARGPAPALRGVAGEHPPLVHLAPAVVGPPDPRLLPRRGDLRGPRAARGRGLGARPRRARHLVLEPAVAVRDARLARRHPCAARLLPDRRALDGARHPVPVGGPDGDDGPRVHGRDPVLARERAHGHPGARRAPDVEVARHRHRPDAADRGRRAPAGVRGGRRVPRLRRRRRALGPAGDLLQPGRALQRGARRAGPPARQQALQRQPARDPARARRHRAAGGRAGARDRRGRLDPLAPAGRQGRGGARDRRLRLPRGRAGRVRLRLRRAVRLVPGADQAAPV